MKTELLTLQEAAELMEKSTQTVRRMIKRGDLKAKRIKTPQGFHYVIERADLPMEKEAVKMQPKKEPVQMLSNSPIQNEVKTLVDEPKSIPTSQDDIPTSQTPVNDLFENDFYELDIIEPKALNPGPELPDFRPFLEQQHREKMELIRILEKLQNELNYERQRPRRFLDRLMDWLFG